MQVHTERIEKWPDVHNFARRSWVFRGQASSNWDLTTSLERCSIRHKLSITERDQLESALLREFRRTYHQYAQHIPDRLHKLEWLSLMQHHGAPTRLLDFTYSLSVAAYFAIEHSDCDAAVWAISVPWLTQCCKNALRSIHAERVDILDSPFEEQGEITLHDLVFKTTSVNCTLPVNPFRLNERLRIQKGLFLAPTNVNASFMENISCLPGHDDRTNVVKLILPQGIRREALERLYYMNISRTTLFPGLDGFAQSLGVFHPSFRTPIHPC